MDWEYAYNYWRKAFIERSEGRFTRDDFDQWFRNGAQHASDSLGYFGTTPEPGSNEDFELTKRVAFIDMLKACADGQFGKPSERRRRGD